MGSVNEKYGVNDSDEYKDNVKKISEGQAKGYVSGVSSGIFYGAQAGSYLGNKTYDLFKSRQPKGFGGPSSKYLSKYGFKETDINTRAIDRYQNFYGRKDSYIQNTIATIGILDQSRAVNAEAQENIESAIWAGGEAQQQALLEAQGYIDDQAAYGYQQAADLESRILGETRTNVAGSGLWNSSMQGQAASFALERGMRARLAVNAEVSQLHQRIALGKGAAASETYNRLAGFYEGARQVNEQSLLYEFDYRAGLLKSGNGRSQEEGSSSDAWVQIGTTVLSAWASTGFAT